MADWVSLDFRQGVKSNAGMIYQNLQLLGAGGNAATFLVLATSGPHRGVPFALKIFRRLSKPDRREAFLGEIDFLRGCEHPCIMRIFDSGTFKDKHPFVVAEYLPRTLLDVIRSGTSMVEKASYALQLLSAIDYLSSLSPPAVHRDIKPQNIFVKGRSCVLGDFGLIKRCRLDEETDRAVVKESAGVGMPSFYRTPDLVSYLRGERDITPKSDVFQLGLVLAHLFTGRNPQKKALQFTDPVETAPLLRFPGALYRPIADLIGKMLTPDPELRAPASEFIIPWQGIFMDAAKRAYELEGRVF
jgi:serine/threonine protein kinase